jgi:hypothetical protein
MTTRRVAAVTVLLVILQTHTGCIAFYAVAGVHTPWKDVSNRDDLWGGFNRDGVYALKVDVFMADHKHYSFGPALAPGEGVITEQPGGQWAGPTTAEEYRMEPEKWPEVMALVDAGTRLRCVQLKRCTYLYQDNEISYVIFAEILDGSHAGQTVEITELTAFVDSDTRRLRPDQYLLDEVGELRE